MLVTHPNHANSPSQLAWRNPWLQLPAGFYQQQVPTPLADPYFLHCNPQALQLLGWTLQQLQHPAMLHCFNGDALLPGLTPIATVYAGHQFGIYTSQLGDGRAILLGEITGVGQTAYEIQLKGAGLTPYSRTLDGRYPISSAIREYLGSAALAALGIAGTRALCLLGSSTQIARAADTCAAILVRIARSHMRFGHFEYFHHKDEFEQLNILVNHAIAQLYPELLQQPAALRPLHFLESIVERTAILVAGWQSVGFNHGVMNTDNMTITGETLDFGPFGFMERYDPAFSANPSDDLNRYQFDQQPEIGRWNCLALAEALSTLLPGKVIPGKLLRIYRQSYQQHYLAKMRAKLGLTLAHPDDAGLIAALLETLAHGNIDYVLFFRHLAAFDANGKNHGLISLSTDPGRLKLWLDSYRDRLGLETSPNQQRKTRMNQTNPCYSLRSHSLSKAMQDSERGDFTEFYRLLAVIQQPFTEVAGMDGYLSAPG